MQYVALGDDSDDMKGHGTHVAGTAAGQRAVDGITESPGKVDGIAPGAKLSFIDLGVSGKFGPSRCVHSDSIPSNTIITAISISSSTKAERL